MKTLRWWLDGLRQDWRDVRATLRRGFRELAEAPRDLRALARELLGEKP